MEINLKNNNIKIHTVNIYNREKIEVVGATEIISSTDKEIIAKLQDSYMFILGSGLTISKLVPEESFLVASGKILGIKYQDKITKKSFLSKVFK